MVEIMSPLGFPLSSEASSRDLFWLGDTFDALTRRRQELGDQTEVNTMLRRYNTVLLALIADGKIWVERSIRGFGGTVIAAEDLVLVECAYSFLDNNNGWFPVNMGSKGDVRIQMQHRPPGEIEETARRLGIALG